MEQFIIAAQNGDIKGLEYQWGCKNEEDVVFFRNIVTIGIQNNYPEIVLWAIKQGNIYEKEDIYECIIEAVKDGSDKVVEALIDLSDEIGYDWVMWSDLTEEAAHIGRLDIIKIVYERAVMDDQDPYYKYIKHEGKDDTRYWAGTIEIAKRKGYQDIVDWFNES